MESIQKHVLFEDQHLVVLDKPAGLLSQSDESGVPSLVDLLRQYFGRHYVGLVHRLDRNTSGAMVVAKRTKAADRLTQSLQKGTLDRIYLAWVEGRFESARRWQHYLSKNEKTNRVTAYRNPASGLKEAVLHATPQGHGQYEGKDLTLVQFQLETGRSHQIRAQASVEGHPLLGDVKYGAAASSFPRTALHSWKIRFDHPMSGEILHFEAPLPEDMRKIQPFK